MFVEPSGSPRASLRPLTVNSMGSAKVSRRRLASSVGHWLTTASVVAVFATVLYYTYKLKVAPLFAYQGLTYRLPQPLEYCIAIALVTLVALNMPRRVRYASDFVLWLLFIMAAAPAMLMPEYMTAVSVLEATKISCAVACCMVMAVVLARLRPSVGSFGVVRIPAKALWAGFGIFAGVVYLSLLLTTGLSLRWTALDDVYDLRAEFASTTASAPLIGYLLPYTYNVVNPAFMARGVYSKRLGFFAVGSLGQVVIYMATGQKSVLFSISGILALSWLFRTFPRVQGRQIMMAVVIGALGALLLDKVVGGYLWTSLFVRRFLIIPGALVAGYVSVFRSLPKVGFAGSPLFWVQSPFTEAPSRIVGRLFVGNEATNANVSLFGHGYANAGYLGMFVETGFLVLILWAADATTRGLPISVGALVLFMPTVALCSASVFTAILTHGFAFALLACAALPRTGWGRRARLGGVGTPTVRRPGG